MGNQIGRAASEATSCAPSCFAPSSMMGAATTDAMLMSGQNGINGQKIGSIPINTFQMCKKGEIVQENIEMQMKIVSRVTASDDDSFDEDEANSSDEEDQGDFMARCQSLTYSVEIGELHERDKFTWVETKGVGRRNASTLEDKKLK